MDDLKSTQAMVALGGLLLSAAYPMMGRARALVLSKIDEGVFAGGHVRVLR
jgi:hypothetical protein